MTGRTREQILEDFKKLTAFPEADKLQLFLDANLEVMLDIRDKIDLKDYFDVQSEKLLQLRKTLEQHTRAMEDLARAIRQMPSSVRMHY